ncbi:Fc.00g112970.m01.CDS01, partial [Cosmosporella sp. VM-42]
MDKIIATYHLPPNFSTPPPPEGPFCLGTVLRSFDVKPNARPLNYEEDRLPIPDAEVYRSRKEGLRATRSKLKSGELGVWAQFLGVEGIGGEISLSAERSGDDVYSFESEETQYFYPRPSYISKTIELPDVQDYIRGNNYKVPVFLITGLKVAKGVSVEMSRGKIFEAKADVGINNPGGVGVEIGPRAGFTSESNTALSFKASSDIVVGIQCLKLYYKTRLLRSAKEMKDEPYLKGAVMVDNDAEGELSQVVDNYEVKDWDDSELDGQVKVTEHNELREELVWVVPT